MEKNGNFIRFVDYLNISPVEISQDVKDRYAQAFSSGEQVQPLYVRIAATHSGRVTRNNGFYLPSKMKAGASSFTDIFPKPIQLHHDSLQDPIGRAVKATYIDTSGQQLRDSFSDAITEENPRETLNDFIEGKMSFEDSVSFVQKYLLEDSAFIQSPHYEGLGYIELIAAITDPDAIQKILDGRLLTGSTGAVTNSAICSVCKQDWAVDSKCIHRPGQVYDKVKCVLIAGDLSYDEYSFVNKPADHHSRIIEVHVNGIQDFVQIDEESFAPEVTFSAVFIDSVDEIKTFWEDEYEEIVGDDPWGRDYAEMMADEELRDAKLTSKQRKALPSSTFCGPNKSFPVNDCAHYMAALRLLGRYKGSGDKDRIRACIERKGKRLGCTSKNKKDATMEKELTIESLDQLNDEEVIKFFDALQAVLVERKIECGCDKPVEDQVEKISKLEEEVVFLKAELETAKQVVTADDSSEKKALLERQKVLQTEIKFLHNDMENLTNELADTIKTLRLAQTKHLVDLTVISSKNLSAKEELLVSLKDKTLEEIQQSLDSLQEQVDMREIIDTLNSGLSSVPDKTVEDPTALQDQTVTSKSEESKVDESFRKIVRFEYMKVRKDMGEQKANKWLDAVCEQNNIQLTKEELLA